MQNQRHFVVLSLPIQCKVPFYRYVYGGYGEWATNMDFFKFSHYLGMGQYL